MTSRHPSGAHPQGHLTAVVVEPTLADTWFAVSGLADRGFHITVAENFLEGRTLIDKHPPSLLITELRLQEYNGLHLVLRGKAARPDMAALVLSATADPVLQSEAERMHATFVLKPTNSQEFLAAVHRTLFRPSDDATPVRPPFERRVADRRVDAGTALDADRRVRERRREMRVTV